ncbi:MAG: hypothetical protein SAJ12_03600 [Jaaginema sp. PMC 1079.18]|nr:hypothetical protein [Jaaginema sp. PMC 1080.18]MEC4850074.1 hypothetical protein [Jaaginema sp. PMC 1079.18]
MDSNELKIIMVAPPGVGKTSFLAAMHEEFNKTFANANINTWTSDSKTLFALEACKQVLKNIDPKLQKKKVTPTNPPDDPWEDEGFVFELGSGGKKFMKLRFTDPSGEYFSPTATSRQREYIEQQLQECDAVVVPIDATALTEMQSQKVNDTGVGTWHQEVNNPSQITNLLKNAYSSLEDNSVPRLIVLAPVKCETYMKYQKKADKLLDRVQKGYRDLLNHLKSPELIDRVAVVVTPVQTIGNVAFSHHKTDSEGVTRFIYHKTPIDAPYSPQDGDQPLRYILRFLINIYLENQEKAILKEKKKLEESQGKLKTEKNKVKEVESKYIMAWEKFQNRENMPGVFKGVANWWDGLQNSRPDEIYEQVNKEYKDVTSSYEKFEREVETISNNVKATEKQIKAFNEALSNFSQNCKNSAGFAILQGFKWLSHSKSL